MWWSGWLHMFMGKMMIRRDVCVNDYEICVDTSNQG